MFKGKQINEGHIVLQKHFLVYAIYVNTLIIDMICLPSHVNELSVLSIYVFVYHYENTPIQIYSTF